MLMCRRSEHGSSAKKHQEKKFQDRWGMVRVDQRYDFAEEYPSFHTKTACSDDGWWHDGWLPDIPPLWFVICKMDASPLPSLSANMHAKLTLRFFFSYVLIRVFFFNVLDKFRWSIHWRSCRTPSDDPKWHFNSIRRIRSHEQQKLMRSNWKPLSTSQYIQYITLVLL